MTTNGEGDGGAGTSWGLFGPSRLVIRTLVSSVVVRATVTGPSPVTIAVTFSDTQVPVVTGPLASNAAPTAGALA